MASAYTRQLLVARAARTAAQEALATAINHCKPLDADIHAVILADRPGEYAACLRKVADIMDTLPTLHARVAEAEAELVPLEEQACWKCHGTGEYTAPTGAFRNGIPYCFACNGQGHQP